MPPSSGQEVGDLEHNHPSAPGMQSLKPHAPWRRKVGAVGGQFRFQRTVIMEKVTSNLVSLPVFSFQLRHPHSLLTLVTPMTEAPAQAELSTLVQRNRRTPNQLRRKVTLSHERQSTHLQQGLV